MPKKKIAQERLHAWLFALRIHPDLQEDVARGRNTPIPEHLDRTLQIAHRYRRLWETGPRLPAGAVLQLLSAALGREGTWDEACTLVEDLYVSPEPAVEIVPLDPDPEAVHLWYGEQTVPIIIRWTPGTTPAALGRALERYGRTLAGDAPGTVGRGRPAREPALQAALYCAWHAHPTRVPGRRTRGLVWSYDRFADWVHGEGAPQVEAWLHAATPPGWPCPALSEDARTLQDAVHQIVAAWAPGPRRR